jgi:hypothetical protein
MTLLTPNGAVLVRLIDEAPRGPRREGLFALWLTLRVVEDLLLVPPQPERAVKRRVAALEQRLSSMSLPHPLRRALVVSLASLREPSRGMAAAILSQLVAPAKEALGAEAAETLARAARAATQRS